MTTTAMNETYINALEVVTQQTDATDIVRITAPYQDTYDLLSRSVTVSKTYTGSGYGSSLAGGGGGGVFLPYNGTSSEGNSHAVGSYSGSVVATSSGDGRAGDDVLEAGMDDDYLRRHCGERYGMEDYGMNLKQKSTNLLGLTSEAQPTRVKGALEAVFKQFGNGASKKLLIEGGTA